MADVTEKFQGPQSEQIQNLFSSIANSYDQANDWITFGMAHSWRDQLVHWSEVESGSSVLDCATGTGDLAIAFKKVVGSRGRVVGTDFCKEMIDLAPQKTEQRDLNVEYQIEDVTHLSFEDNEFDVTSIAYGIRNVQDRKKGFEEMARVTKPGGYVMVLETGVHHNPILRFGIDLHSRTLVPLIGGWLSGNKGAYNYLHSSSAAFPGGKDFVKVMMATGVFESVEYKTLFFGASYIYKAKVK